MVGKAIFKQETKQQKVKSMYSQLSHNIFSILLIPV